MKRTAVYTGTRNVYSDMVTAAKSLIANDGADKVVFLTEDTIFPDALPDIIQTINVHNQQYFRADGPNFTKRWTYMTLMKVAAPLMLKRESRLLVLDVDTIVDGSLDGLWSLPDAPIYMTKEIGRPGAYYNAGVMLINPKLFSDEAETIVYRLNHRDYQFCEQDAINEVMRFNIAELPSIYNSSNWTVPPDGDPIITHYAAVRKWQTQPLWQKYERMTWGEVMRLKKNSPS